MNKFIFSAIAIAAASSTSFANGSDWLQLDQDIASLSTTVNNAEGVTMGGLLRNSYRDGGSLGGWAFDDADVWIEASLEEFDMRISFDVESGSLSLEDAYVSWTCGSDIDMTWGRFKPHALRSADIDPENMLFIDRSLLGAEFDHYDNGLMVAGHMSGVHWALALQNGDDGTGEELMITAHASYNIGNGVSMKEGAMNSGDEIDATIGLTYEEMQEAAEDAIIMLDVALTMGQFSGSFEMADGDDDDISGTLGQSPNALTIGYLLADNMELAFRHEDKDNAADETKDSFGFNYYMHGHNAKWSVNYIDDEGASDEVIAVGLTVGRSR